MTVIEKMEIAYLENCNQIQAKSGQGIEKKFSVNAM